MTTRIFIYGTLRRGGAWHDAWIADMPENLRVGYRGKVIMPGTLFDGGLPMMKVGERYNKRTVVGELYDFPDKVFRELSKFEVNAGYEVASGYAKDPSDGFGIACLVFLYGRSVEGFPIVESGDWIKYVKGER